MVKTKKKVTGKSKSFKVFESLSLVLLVAFAIILLTNGFDQSSLDSDNMLTGAAIGIIDDVVNDTVLDDVVNDTIINDTIIDENVTNDEVIGTDTITDLENLETDYSNESSLELGLSVDLKTMAWDDCPDASGTWVVNNSETLSSNITCNEVIINNSATLTIDGPYTITTNNLTLDVGSYISADEEGCPSSQSPTVANVCYNQGGYEAGVGEGGNSNGGDGGGGAGHGGTGGDISDYPKGGASYGSALRPTLYGSGGGTASSAGGAGGGSIRIIVQNTFNLSGEITVDGGNGVNGSYGSGGGSGGSIWVSAYNLTGSGFLTATGGDGSNGGGGDDDGGSGAGGRIAVYYNDSTNFNMSLSSVSSGTKVGSAYAGGSGTLLFVDIDDNNAWIYEGMEFNSTDYADDGTFKSTAEMNFNFSNIYFMTEDVRLMSNAVVQVENLNFSLPAMTITGDPATENISFALYDGLEDTTDSFNISSSFISGNLTFEDFTRVNFYSNTGGFELINETFTGNWFYFDVLNLTIDENSGINTNALGCPSSQSPNSDNVCSSQGSGAGYGEGGDGGGGSGGGGGHGGTGGNRGVGGLAGYSYDSALRPTLYGSGGGLASSTGGAGGGVVRAVVHNVFNLSGKIVADGGNGIGAITGSGGGSGGSIWVSAYNITGVGNLSAVGGLGGSGAGADDGGSGSGGRISVYFNTSTLNDLSLSTVAGGVGVGNGYAGEAGTLLFVDIDDNLGWFDDGMEFNATDYSEEGIFKLNGSPLFNFVNITPLSPSRLRFKDNPILNASILNLNDSNVVVNDGTRLDLIFSDLFVDINANYSGSNSNALNLSLEHWPIGKINWIKGITSIINLSSNTNITYNNVFVNSSAAAGLNVSANITLNNLTFSEIVIGVDVDDDGTFAGCPGNVCTLINYTGGDVLFNVTHFTSYKIFDDFTDTPIVNLVSPDDNGLVNNPNVTFIYNVSDASNNIVQCDLIINDVINLTDNSITKDINQNFTIFLVNNTYNWSVNCTDGGVPAASGISATRNVNVTAQLLVSETLNSSPTNINSNVVVSGKVNFTDGTAASNAAISIYLNGTLQNSGWWNSDWNYRTNVTVNTGYAPRGNNTVVKKIINFTAIMETSGILGTLDNDSIRVIDQNGREVDSGILRWVVENSTAMLRWKLTTNSTLSKETDYTYYIYFDTFDNGAKLTPSYSLPKEFFLCSGADDNNNFDYAYSNYNRTLPTSWTAWDPQPSAQKDETTIFDLDNDGDLDVAFTSDNDNKVYVYTNDGDASWSFTLSQSFSIADTDWQGIAEGDFNEDGWQDLVVAAGVYGNCRLLYYQNYGNGTLASAVDKGSCGIWQRKIGVEDFDNDNNIDVLVGSYDNGCLKLFTGDGTGNFTDNGCIANSQNFNDDWHGIWPVDADNDGDIDMYGTSNNAYVTYFSNNGAGTFANGVNQPDGGILDSSPIQNLWSSGSVGDYDNDGAMDLTSGTWQSTPNYLGIYWGNKSGSDLFNSGYPESSFVQTASGTNSGYKMFCGGPDYVKDITFTGPSNNTEHLVTTNSTGHYSFNLTAPSTGGTYPVVVNLTYLGYYGENTKNLTISQFPIINSITYNATPEYESDFHLIANVTDDNILWVNFTIYDSTGYPIINNTNGTQASDLWNSSGFTIDQLGPYNYNITAMDEDGNSATTSGVIDFVMVGLAANQTTVNVGQVVELNGQVIWSNSTPIPNWPVNIYLNNTLQGSTIYGDGSDGVLTVSSGTTTLDTDANPGGFNYTSITVSAGATLTATGSNPLYLRSTGNVIIEGTLDVSGADGGAVSGSAQVSGGAGVAGAGDGGDGGASEGNGNNGSNLGQGQGGIYCVAGGDVAGGGGGASYATAGGGGGNSYCNPDAVAGSTYGDANLTTFLAGW